MHRTSYSLMRYFADRYLCRDDFLEILDVGSMNVNGTYRDIFNRWNYYGLDLCQGNNVDIVALSDNDFGLSKQYDVVISGNCMEHVRAPWLWIKEVVGACRGGGLVCIITPTEIGLHRHPIDCWRIYPDGMEYLIKDLCGMEILELKLNDGMHKDTFVIARKKHEEI